MVHIVQEVQEEQEETDEQFIVPPLNDDFYRH